MNKYHKAQDEVWTEATLLGVKGFFVDLRIDRNTVTDYFCFYEVADGDSDGIPCRVAPFISVNFYGTFISKESLPTERVDEHGDIFFNKDEWEEGYETYGYNEIVHM